MARMNREEHDAAIARARAEGAREIVELIARMRELGLSMSAVSGALEATLRELDDVATKATEAAVESRAEKTPEE